MYFATNTIPRSRLGSLSACSSPSRLRPRSLARYGYTLGLGDDQSILTQVFQGESGAPAAPLVQQTVSQAMSQGALWTTENCSGIPASSNITSTALQAGGAVAMKIAGATGPAAPFVLVAGGLMELFGSLFGNHAAKVKQEQQIICAVVAACNDTLTSIDQLLQSGQISTTQASQALDAMYSQLTQNVQPIIKQDSGHCNAACFILAEARGVIAKRKEQYSQIIPANAPPGSYQQTCRNVSVNGDLLTAQCQDSTGNWQNTSLQSISACSGGEIANINGQLRCCDPNRPAGSTVCNPWPPPATTQPSPSPTGTTAPSTLPSAVSSSVANVASVVSNLATSTGIPTWAIWGIGALLLSNLL